MSKLTWISLLVVLATSCIPAIDAALTTQTCDTNGPGGLIVLNAVAWLLAVVGVFVGVQQDTRAGRRWSVAAIPLGALATFAGIVLAVAVSIGSDACGSGFWG